MRRPGVAAVLAAALAVVSASPALAEAPAGADGWVAAEESESAAPVVLRFRRVLALARAPESFPVEVTADNRFVLYVNGRRVAAGPSAGDLANWRYATLDLAPFLKRGDNVLAAVVWNGVPRVGGEAAEGLDKASLTAPAFQQSVATGFRLEGRGDAAAASTRRPGWRVRVDAGHRLESGAEQLAHTYYVAGAAEVVEGASADPAWAGPTETGAGWTDATPAPAAARRTLTADRLPPQRFAPAHPGTVVRTDLPAATEFPRRAATVPAHSRASLLLRRDAMIAAYPALTVSGGRGAKVKLTYAEALADADGKRGDRNLVEDRRAVGLSDTFLPDGGRRRFAPLWWRTWRYLEIEVETADAPLRLERLEVHETGYPFETVGRFESSDPELDRIWRIGWRTAQVDAHETYMDTAYWEQLQYVGDTRLQALISYAVAGDPRLAEQALDAFAASEADGGLLQGAYPSRTDNVIATFSPLWIGMLHDWWTHQPDTAVARRHLPRMRRLLAWAEARTGPDGLQMKNPHWNFVDWVGLPWSERDRFPAHSRSGESCLTTAVWLGAMRQAADLEAALGDAGHAHRYRTAAARWSDAIRRRCWDAERRLFADDPDREAFSQHMNALAVLYDVAPRELAPELLDRITVPGAGVDAPPGLHSTSYYFAWYLVRAFEHAGRADRYLALLETWRGLLALNYTTWPESRGETRSDTHAWSAHPTADLLGLVAGVRPGAPGYATVRVAPALGTLTRLDATAATPHGPVRVRYRRDDGRLTAVIDTPGSLVGVFEWGGARRALRPGRNRFVLPDGDRAQGGL